MSDEAGRGAGPAGDEAADGEEGVATPAERFRRRIAELEDRLEASDDAAEREALRRDIEHLRAGLRAVERSGS